MADKLKPWRDELLKRLDEVCSRDGRVPRHVAENLVAGSAWWESHPSGPVPAPKDAGRIEGNENTWFVEFGANSFLVAAAAHGCCQRIRQWVQRQQVQPGHEAWTRLNVELQAVVRGSVANYRGDTYSNYGHDAQGKLIFGAHAIYVNDFVGGIAGYLKTPALHTFQKRGPTSPTPSTPRTKGKAKVPLIPGRVFCPHCQAEVNASNLDSHIQKRCKKSVEAKALAENAKRLAEMLAKPLPPLRLGPGLVICPQCKGVVKKAHLKEHKAGICQNRPVPPAPKPPVPKALATPDQHQSLGPLAKKEVICPWCGNKMKKSRLVGHQARRCLQRPQREQ